MIGPGDVVRWNGNPALKTGAVAEDFNRHLAEPGDVGVVMSCLKVPSLKDPDVVYDLCRVEFYRTGNARRVPMSQLEKVG